MIKENIFQSIFDELSKYLLPEWKKLIVYLEYGNASYSISFYIQRKKEYIKCYDIPNVSEEELTESFSKIDKLISAERSNEMEEQWTNMTMVIDQTGHIHTDFDYSDISQGTYQFKKDWKKKYLI